MTDRFRLLSYTPFLCCKNMRRKLLLMLAMIPAASCGLKEIGPKSDHAEVWVGPGSAIVGEGAGTHKKVWYATGFDYPEGYDWKTDSAVGEVRCSLIVFANGVPMMKIPVGSEYEVSPDPDMHRMIAGDVYTDYSTDSETVIKRNGETLFRYEGREMMIGMDVVEDDVYTLGQSRSGQGFSYRKNGELIYKNQAGSLFDHFLRDSCGHSFAYAETVSSSSDAVERYYAYVEGEVRQIAVREDLKKVWDVCFDGDKVCFIASLVGINNPVIVSDHGIEALHIQSGYTMITGRFISDSYDGNVEMVLNDEKYKVRCGIWKECQPEYLFAPGMTIFSTYRYDEGIHCIVNLNGGSGVVIYREGDIYNVTENYAVMGSRPLAMVDGILHVGLTSLSGKDPVVWKDGDMQQLKMNGYISSITVD